MDAASNQQASIVGSRPCFFRPPYGASNSTTLDLAQARNMAVFNWSVDTLDWEARGSADPFWIDRIINLAEQGGTQTHPVILFHNQPGGNPATVAALPSIIAFYRDRGYTFVDLAGNVSPVDPTRADISPVGVAAVRSAAGTLLAFVRGTDGALYVSTATSGRFRGLPAHPRRHAQRSGGRQLGRAAGRPVRRRHRPSPVAHVHGRRRSRAAHDVRAVAAPRRRADHRTGRRIDRARAGSW